MALYVVTRSGQSARRRDTHASAAPRVAGCATDTCETIFWALDGRDLVVRGRRWHVEVFSVVELAGRRYVQLSLSGPEACMLTLRLTPATPVRRLIPAVLTRLTRPTTSGEIIDVR